MEAHENKSYQIFAHIKYNRYLMILINCKHTHTKKSFQQPIFFQLNTQKKQDRQIHIIKQNNKLKVHVINSCRNSMPASHSTAEKKWFVKLSLSVNDWHTKTITTIQT